MKNYKLDTPLNLQELLNTQQIAINRLQDDRINESIQDLLYAFNQAMILCAVWREIIDHKLQQMNDIKL